MAVKWCGRRGVGVQLTQFREGSAVPAPALWNIQQSVIRDALNLQWMSVQTPRNPSVVAIARLTFHFTPPPLMCE